MENLSNNHKDRPNQHGAFCFEFDEKLIETETTTLSKFPNGGKAIIEKKTSNRRKKYVIREEKVRENFR